MSFNKLLKPKHEYNLIRLGKKNDGGYLVDRESVVNSKVLISLGINDDWSFEEHFLKLNPNVNIKCFDDKLDILFLIKKIVKQIFITDSFKKIFILISKIKNLLTYLNLKKKIKFIKKYIHYKDLHKILKKESDNIFLKIDIEGGEYRLLNEILSNQKKFNGVILEFHDCDLHINKIYNFIKSMKLKLIHIHGNNFSRTDLNGDPIVIELVFSKDPTINKKICILPNKLDMPCDPENKEITLKFR